MNLRIGISATITAEPLVPLLGAALLSRGFEPACQVAPYGQVFQTCLDWRAAFAPSAEADEPDLDVIFVLWRHEDLLAEELTSLSGGSSDALDHALSKLDALGLALKGLANSFPGTIVATLPPYPQSPPHDLRDLTLGRATRQFHRGVSRHWEDLCSEIERVVALDLDLLQREAGASRIEDLRKWYLYRQPYHEFFWHLIGEELARILAGGRGAARKCLVVDCDNTLWGGVVGEEGLEGIVLGEDFPGSAFCDFQRQLVTLHQRGVLIALASKNDESAVWEVFDRHDAMVLKREHLAAWRIDWNSKADNIADLSEELNFATDAFVFIDDSASEIGEVRERLPDVHCLLVPSELARLPDLLRGTSLFDTLEVTSEDRQRTEMTRSEAERMKLGSAMTREEFLQSLELRVVVRRASPDQLGRVTQLVNKTNQFNLTTIRRSRDEVTELAGSANYEIYSLSVTDRFGAYGLVGVAIVATGPSEWRMDSFLMSCRVLGREVESAFLAQIALRARSAGASTLLGSYVPTAKNRMASSFLADHSFVPNGESEQSWRADINDIPSDPSHIESITEDDTD